MNYIIAKHTGIMFQQDMILAYIDQRKNQTRRMKGLKKINENPDDWHLLFSPRGPGIRFVSFASKKDPQKVVHVNMPYGGRGDCLYFKETWKMWERDSDGKDFIHYRADDAKVDPTWWTEDDWLRIFGKLDGKWNSSMFMPRICARFREIPILGVRVERLHDITESDAVNEGWNAEPTSKFDTFAPARSWYFDLFAKINGQELTDKNPWVFVYEFPKHGAEK